jgi:4-amino-4-deoxy-L-arabinose transferase-like glycosyltransferase
MNKFYTQKNLIFLSGFICFFYIIVFKPIIADDGYGYMEIAKIIAGVNKSLIDTSDRQPFYSIILYIFYLFFNEPNLLKAIIVFQYILIFVNSILLFKLFRPIIKNDAITFFIPIAYLINLTTILFGYMVLSETVASFLFLLLIYLIVKLPDKIGSYWYFALVGIINSLLFLTRFSTFFTLFLTPLIFCFYFYFVQKKHKPTYSLLKVLVFLVPVSISLFTLSYNNFKRNNFFFLFPTTGTISHYYSILSTINDDNFVSLEYKPVLKLFLEKKDSIENISVKLDKGSLLNYFGRNKFQKLTLGWSIYANAENELFNYYNLQGKDRNRAILAKYLSGFYQQIADQNRKELLYYRVSSFLLCLRANRISMPDEFGKTNLNILPPWIVIGYKVFVIFFISCFYLFSIYFILKFIRFKNLNIYFEYLSIIVFILYFPLIGILTADVFNITRYKFLSEPLIIGLNFYYILIFRKHIDPKKVRTNL